MWRSFGRYKRLAVDLMEHKERVRVEKALDHCRFPLPVKQFAIYLTKSFEYDCGKEPAYVWSLLFANMLLKLYYNNYKSMLSLYDTIPPGVVTFPRFLAMELELFQSKNFLTINAIATDFFSNKE